MDGFVFLFICMIGSPLMMSLKSYSSLFIVTISQKISWILDFVFFRPVQCFLFCFILTTSSPALNV